MKKNVYKLSDEVIGRIAVVLQECILLGADIVDIMRQIEVEQSDENPGELVLTPAYVTMVENIHKRLLEESAELIKNKTFDTSSN